jgi:hypothetical protein
MQRTATWGYTLVAIVNLVLLSAFSMLPAAPRVEVDNETFDFGKVREGSKRKVTHAFKLKNTGDENLVIEKVKPG